MHREFDPTAYPFRPVVAWPLYLLTGFVGALMLLDLWPLVAGWLEPLTGKPGWQPLREIFGLRLALYAAILGGARSLYASLEKLTHGKPSAELAIAIACIAAIVLGEPLIAAEVVFIGLLGECLEAWMSARTQRELGKLSELFPQRCWVLRDGVEVRTRTEDLVVGDVVVVKPGGRIPVDGPIVAGHCAVETSSLTGESLPRDVQPGQRALAGSLVLDGTLTICAEKVQTHTVAGQMIAVTGDAMKTKLHGERLADKLAAYFLPIVLALAVVTFLLNVGFQYFGLPNDGRRFSWAVASRAAIYPTLGVLVVACPCPLLLATPAAVVAALGRLAGTGILVKRSSALEQLAKASSFAFDKTGTLTTGQLNVVNVEPISGNTDELLLLTAAVEQNSEHPIANAIVRAAAGQVIPACTEFKEFAGGGASGVVDGERITLGSTRFLTEQGIEVPVVTSSDSQVYVARGLQLLGVLSIRDELRPEALGVLTELKELGFTSLTLLTGDRKAVAEAVARELPLTAVHAELLPNEKSERVSDSAYLGDGMNDAPALAKSLVGLAVGTGTDLAATAGDIVLMGEPLRVLPLLVRLSRETVKVIRQNIYWFGFVVNLVGVVLTGVLWPLFATTPEWADKSPLVGVIFHQVGSVAVLLNSMRLLGFERTATSRWQSGLRTVDRWLTLASLDDLVHGVFHRWKSIATVLLCVGITAWLLSSCVVVQADEVAVCQRFGAYRAELAPGLHVRWPWPVENVTRFKPSEVRLVELGFRSTTGARQQELIQAREMQQRLRRPGSPASQSWASGHADTINRLTDESLLLTGDGELVELLATIRYTIAEPKVHLEHAADVEPLLRSCAESTLRELTGSRQFQRLLGAERPDFEREANRMFAVRLNSAAPDGLGIRIGGLTIHDLHPPTDVVASYHAVAEAIQKRDKAKLDAEAEASRMVSRAEDDARKQLGQANSDAQQKLAEATALRDVFLAWHNTRNMLTPDEEKLVANDAAKREQTLMARRSLTDLRLTLDALASVLRTRNKILVDADKLPGMRKLFLIDPDLMPKAPLPLAFPRGTNPDQRDQP